MNKKIKVDVTVDSLLNSISEIVSSKKSPGESTKFSWRNNENSFRRNG